MYVKHWVMPAFSYRTVFQNYHLHLTEHDIDFLLLMAVYCVTHQIYHFYSVVQHFATTFDKKLHNRTIPMSSINANLRVLFNGNNYLQQSRNRWGRRIQRLCHNIQTVPSADQMLCRRECFQQRFSWTQIYRSTIVASRYSIYHNIAEYDKQRRWQCRTANKAQVRLFIHQITLDTKYELQQLI